MCSRAPLPEQTSEQQAAQTTAAQHTTPDQQASEMPIPTAFILVFILFVLIFLLMRSRAPLPEQTGEQQAAQATAAQHPAPNQQASEAMLFATAFILVFIVLVLVLLLMRSHAALPEQAGKQQAAQTTAAQHPTPDQQASETPIPTALILVFIHFVLAFLLMRSRASLPEQADKQQAAQTTATQHPAPNQQTSEAMLFATAFIFVFIISSPAFPQKVRQQQIAHAAAAQHAAADQQSHDLLFVSPASFRPNLFSIT